MIMFFTLFTIETATMMSIFFHRIIKRMGKYFFYDMLWLSNKKEKISSSKMM